MSCGEDQANLTHGHGNRLNAMEEAWEAMERVSEIILRPDGKWRELLLSRGNSTYKGPEA